MNSPLYVLALRATSELNDQQRQRISPDSTANKVAAATPLATHDSSSKPHGLVRQSGLRTLENGDKQYEMLTQNPLTIWSPDRVHLRVDASSSAYRLDPFAIELIESVLSKGTTVLSRPVFPYTYETEPMRCMEIRTHLRRRYAAILKRDAPLATRVAMTQRLLHLWGAKLVKTRETPAVTSFTSRHTNVTSASSLMPLQPQGRNNQGESNDADALILAVSPLKRPNAKMNPCASSNADDEKYENGLDRHVVRGDDFIMTQDDDSTQEQETDSCPVVPTAQVVVATPPNCVVASKEAWLAQETASLFVSDEVSSDRFVASTATTTTTTTTTNTPKRTLVASKEALLMRHCKKQKLLVAKDKKKQRDHSSAVRRIVRRWTVTDRQLYLDALDKHGFAATGVAAEAIKRMIPGK